MSTESGTPTNRNNSRYYAESRQRKCPNKFKDLLNDEDASPANPDALKLKTSREKLPNSKRISQNIETCADNFSHYTGRENQIANVSFATSLASGTTPQITGHGERPQLFKIAGRNKETPDKHQVKIRCRYRSANHARLLRRAQKFSYSSSTSSSSSSGTTDSSKSSTPLASSTISSTPSASPSPTPLSSQISKLWIFQQPALTDSLHKYPNDDITNFDIPPKHSFSPMQKKPPGENVVQNKQVLIQQLLEKANFQAIDKMNEILKAMEASESNNQQEKGHQSELRDKDADMDESTFRISTNESSSHSSSSCPKKCIADILEKVKDMPCTQCDIEGTGITCGDEVKLVNQRQNKVEPLFTEAEKKLLQKISFTRKKGRQAGGAHEADVPITSAGKKWEIEKDKKVGRLKHKRKGTEMTNGTDSPRLHTTWHTGSVTAGPLISRKIKIRRSQHPDLKRMPRTSKQVARLSDLATNKNEPPKKDTKNRKKKRKRKRKGRKKRKKKKGKKRTYKGFKKNKASKNEPPCVLQ